MLSLADKLNLGVLWSVDFAAIAANVLLIVAIIFKTPKQLRAYSVFLLNNALVDLTTATASALATVRVIVNHEEFTTIFVFLGPCSLVSEDLCRFAQALHENLVQQSTIILLLSFGYRLYIISDFFPNRPPPSLKQLWMLCLSPFLFISLLTAMYYLEETDVSEELLIRFDLQGYSTTNFNIMSTRVLYVITIGCVISPIVLTAILIIRRKLLHRIAQSKTTDKRQHEFIARALTYQTLLPCAAAGGVTLWMLDLFQIWSSEFSERFIMVLFSMFSLASPLINIIVLPPYRAMLPFPRAKILKVGPNQHVADFTSATSMTNSQAAAILFRVPSQQCVDLTTATASALAVVRVIENHGDFTCVFVFLGPCSLISEDLRRMAQALHKNLVQQSTIILLFSFAYRLYILSDLFPTRPPPTRNQIWILCLSSFLFIALLTDGYYLEEKDASDELVSRFGLQGYTTAHFNIMSSRVMYVIIIGCLISPIALTSIFIIRRKLLYRIAQSKTTDKRQHEFIARALTYQAMLPCAAAVGVTFWLLDLCQIWGSEFSERCIMVMFSVFSLASPLINFIVLPPYRAMLPFPRAKNPPVGPNQNVADFTSATSITVI